MFQYLSNPEYLHVLLNPLPVYGLAVGLLVLVIALCARSRGARAAALSVIFLCALSAWPVAELGEKAESRVLAMADGDGARWLHEHEERAERLLILFYATAGLAALGLLAEWKRPRMAVVLALLTAVVAAASLAAGGYIASAGGRIRHQEFRYILPPEDPKK